MIRFSTSKFLLPVAVLGLSSIGGAQDAMPTLQFRVALHDPFHPAPELFVPDSTGKLVELELSEDGLSNPQRTMPVDGSLALYRTNIIDPENPGANVVATVKIPKNIQRAIVILVGLPEPEPAYRMMVLDDSLRAFPMGESRVLSLVAGETALQAGEHRLPVQPGKVVKIPKVLKVNEFLRAQTNFYYKKGDDWVVFTERQLRYFDKLRRVFIVHAGPKSARPFVRTIVDTERAAAAQ